MKFEDKVAIVRIKKHKGRETEAFLNDVKKMTEGEPLEYVLGEVDFCGAKIDLSLRPMIPRPETEYWVQSALEEIQHKHRATSLECLELFSGSGAIGITILKHIRDSHMTFVEIDKKYHDQIAISLAKNALEEKRATLIAQDVVAFLAGSDDKKFDYIFAVPPYIPHTMKDEVMKELSAEEPLFFFDKKDGYYYHTCVLNQAKEFLQDKGVLYLEFDMTQRERIEKLAQEYGFTSYHFLKDPYGNDGAIVLEK